MKVKKLQKLENWNRKRRTASKVLDLGTLWRHPRGD
jgi:hypothetical protein